MRSVRVRAIFRICGNESQPGLQLVKRLVTPLVALVVRTFFLFTLSLYKQKVPKEQGRFHKTGAQNLYKTKLNKKIINECPNSYYYQLWWYVNFPVREMIF